MRYVRTDLAGVRYTPPRYDPETGKELWKRAPAVKTQMYLKVQDVFDVVLADEAHGACHHDTKLWESLYTLHPPYVWLITATPMINNTEDIIGLL